jgi:RNA polymerase sigma-70 factor (ECF subfamily)
VSRGNAVEPVTETEQRFDPLFQAHYDAIYRYCVRRLGPSDAEDAAADVFAVAWRRLDEMPAGEASRAWLFAVAYRVVGNRFRSRRRQSRLSARLEATRPEATMDTESATGGDVHVLLAALDGLSPTDRELLRLSSWDGLTRSEIAVVLGIKENAVDQRLHRARARLKTGFDRLVSQTSGIEPREASA